MTARHHGTGVRSRVSGSAGCRVRPVRAQRRAAWHPRAEGLHRELRLASSASGGLLDASRRGVAAIARVCERAGVRMRHIAVRVLTGGVLGLAAIGCWTPLAEGANVAGSTAAAATAAATTDQAPALLSDADFDQIPVRRYSYAASGPSRARAASVAACRLYAFDPFTRAPKGTQNGRRGRCGLALMRSRHRAAYSGMLVQASPLPPLLPLGTHAVRAREV